MPWAVIATLILAFILGWRKVWIWRRQRNIPPGAILPPMPLTTSILGHIELLQRDFQRTKAIEWARKYGPVYRLRVYCTNLVLLNDINSIRKFGTRDELLNRADCFLSGAYRRKGLGVLNGDLWKANKKFCMSMLRDLGFSNTPLQTRIKEECCRLADRIGELNGKPVFIYPDVVACVSNNVSTLFFGSTKPGDEVWQKDMHRLLGKTNTLGSKAGFFSFVPLLVRRMLQYIPSTTDGQVRTIINDLQKIFSAQKQKHQLMGPEDSDAEFLHAYLDKIEKAKHDAKPMFQEEYLLGNITTFTTAGSFSPSLEITSHLTNFAAHKDTLQARVQREIDEVIGAHRLPTWEDRKAMPFTLACIWEMHRWQTSSGFGLPRLASDDVVVDGIFIPKNTVLLFNLWAVHNDPATWDEPALFKPSRYLHKDGSIMERKPSELIPFSVGRRSCPGEMFASIEIFFIITLLLQRYDVVLDEPIKQDLNDPKVLQTLVGKCKLRFLPRNVNKA